MIAITFDVLRAIMPLANGRIPTYVQPLSDAMEIHEIDTPLRAAAFLAQIAHESGELRWMQELASGAEYEGRKDLGNTEPGDGVKFKGRGPIQVTGRDNYRLCSRDLYGDERLLDSPQLLELPFDGCMASAWFWRSRGLNDLADVKDFEHITRRINGGLNGQEEREVYYKTALGVLGAAL
jgi:putative chitinase